MKAYNITKLIAELKVTMYSTRHITESLLMHYSLFVDFFRNKSGKPQPMLTKVGTHALQVKGRQRSRNFGCDRLSGGEMEGSKVSPTPVFLEAIRDDFLTTSQQPIFAKCGHDT